MYKKWVILLILIPIASAELFPYYDGDLFTARKIFNPELPAVFFSSFDTLIAGRVAQVITPIAARAPKVEVKVILTENGLEPNIVNVKLNEKVTWVNQRKSLDALVLGVREISAMKSDYLAPGEEFVWTFEKAGTYTYVDGIIIGTAGKVVVS